MLFVYIEFIAVALAVIVERYSEKSQKIDDLPILVTCQSGTSVMLSSEVNSSVAHGST